MSELIEFFLGRVSVVTIVNNFLLRLRLAKAKTFHVLAELVVILVLSWPDIFA